MRPFCRRSAPNVPAYVWLLGAHELPHAIRSFLSKRFASPCGDEAGVGPVLIRPKTVARMGMPPISCEIEARDFLDPRVT